MGSWLWKETRWDAVLIYVVARANVHLFPSVLHCSCIHCPPPTKGLFTTVDLSLKNQNIKEEICLLYTILIYSEAQWRCEDQWRCCKLIAGPCVRPILCTRATHTRSHIYMMKSCSNSKYQQNDYIGSSFYRTYSYRHVSKKVRTTSKVVALNLREDNQYAIHTPPVSSLPSLVPSFFSLFFFSLPILH